MAGQTAANINRALRNIVIPRILVMLEVDS
jgi:hypothetical protein